MNTVVLVTRDGLGQVGPQDRKFGMDMFERFLHAMESQPEKPQTVCFYTDGVKLTCQGSPVVPALQLIAGMGVRLLICKTCLEYFRLMDKVAVGEVSTMNEIMKHLLAADKVITI
jgi:sulfur relay (sulfurtransferase) complex TusBCD TusD component (DsrE family)